ncbi:hypothetical protein [Marinovum sp.]|uniref:hypothetical protein n=1 Tax=Marinovum sp. TaxID=2024839 RepID=UPI002B2761BC|nr:hypothetical protein [Marinovum sp.]
MRALSPLSLLLVCWGLTGLVASLALAMPQAFDLVPVFMARHDQDRAAFNGLGALWMLTALSAWSVGNLAARAALPRHRPALVLPNLARAARLTFLVNLLLLGVTLLWIVLTARQVGGLRALVLLTAAEAVTARDFLLQNKLFTGMRLVYASLPATGCLAAAILIAGRGRLRRRSRLLCRLTLLLNVIALSLLPIVMSQRLLLLQFTLSAYLAACVIRRRLFALPWLVTGAGLFLAVWVVREALINPSVATEAVPVGLQKLAFYTVNDLWNGFAPVAFDVPRTWGAETFHGLAVLTLTDGWVEEALAPLAPAIDAVRGGGEFPILTAPYVDFGPFGGALLLLMLGFGLRLLFHRAQGHLLATIAYAQFGAALLFSSHGPYLLHQNVLASLLVVAGILRLSRPGTQATAEVIPLVHPRHEGVRDAA